VAAAGAIAAALPRAAGLRAVRAPAAGARKDRPALLGPVLPYALALLMPFTVSVSDAETPTIDDLKAATHMLQSQRGWTAQQVIDSLKTPQSMTVLSGMRQLVLADHRSGAASPAEGESAFLLVLASDDLPHPLPASWTVLRRAAKGNTVLIVTRSRLDWSRIQVCTRPADAEEQDCEASGLRFNATTPSLEIAHMPRGGSQWRGALTIRVPLRSAPRNASEAIFMPRMRHVCPGSIASDAGGALAVSTDQRHAESAAGDPIADAVITLEWQVGSRDCGPDSFDGLPPFVIAGDPRTVTALEAMLRRREAGRQRAGAPDIPLASVWRRASSPVPSLNVWWRTRKRLAVCRRPPNLR
jgi:hypothetical protein